MRQQKSLLTSNKTQRECSWGTKRQYCKDIPVLFPLGLAGSSQARSPCLLLPAFKADTTGHANRVYTAHLLQHSVWVGCSVSLACQRPYFAIPALGQWSERLLWLCGVKSTGFDWLEAQSSFSLAAGQGLSNLSIASVFSFIKWHLTIP